MLANRMSNPKLHDKLMVASGPFDSNIRKSACRNGMRMLESDTSSARYPKRCAECRTALFRCLRARDRRGDRVRARWCRNDARLGTDEGSETTTLTYILFVLAFSFAATRKFSANNSVMSVYKMLKLRYKMLMLRRSYSQFTCLTGSCSMGVTGYRRRGAGSDGQPCARGEPGAAH
jgi:hypothetical protein